MKKGYLVFGSIVIVVLVYAGYRVIPRDRWTFVTGIGGAEIVKFLLPSLDGCRRYADEFFNHKDARLYECRKNCKRNDLDECEQNMVCNLPNGCAPKGGKEEKNYKSYIQYEKNSAQARQEKEQEQFEFIGDRAIENEKKLGDGYTSLYSTDGTVIYRTTINSLEGRREVKVAIKQADAKTFQTLRGDWAKDANHVYYAGIIIPELDSLTFVEINKGEYGGSFVKDKNAVYRENIQPDVRLWIVKLDNADPKTFTQINDFYGKDAAHVYYLSELISEADPSTFEVISSIYAKDKNHAYVGKSIKEGVDSKIFSP